MTSLIVQGLSYAEAARRNRPPLDPLLRLEYDALCPVIKKSISSWEEFRFFLDRSCNEKINSLKKKQPTAIYPFAKKTPSLPSITPIAQSVNCIALETSKSFPYPLYFPINTLIPPNYYASSGYCQLPHHTYPLRNECCYGMSVWFGILYLRTKDLFTHSIEQLLWLGQQFQVGAKLPEALLQTLQFDVIGTGEELGLKIGNQPSNQKISQPLQVYHFKSQLTATFTKKLNKIKPGIYLINNNDHQCVYAKVNNTQGYFFDPNQGIIQITGSQFPLHFLIRKAMSYDSFTAAEEENLETLIDQICQHRQMIAIEPITIQKKKRLIQSIQEICKNAKVLIDKFNSEIGTDYEVLIKKWIRCQHSLENFAVTSTNDLLNILDETKELLLLISDYTIYIYPIKLIDAHSDSTSTGISDPSLDAT